MIQLRDYQIKAVDELRSVILEHKRPILCLPTGAGKTSIAGHMIQSGANNGKKIHFLAHRTELIFQCYQRLRQFGVYAGIIKGSFKYNGHSVNVASVQTLVKRHLPPADIIFIDECHHATAGSYKKIIEAYPDAFIIGLTATPWRMDGRPLGDIFNKIIKPIDMMDLIEQGYLVPPRYFASSEHVDLDGVKTSKGDYDNKELFTRFDKPKLYAGVVENYKTFSEGKKAIVFNLNVEHSKNTTEEFIKAGYASAHLDATTGEIERAAIIEKFRSGEIQILNNVNILTEGFDLPDIEVVVINRATKSLSLYMQMVGRGLRPWGNKSECIVIDHGDNVKRLGFAEDDRDYSLTGRKKKKGAEVQNIKECPKCLALIPSAKRECLCGYVFPVEERSIEVHNAKFEEIKRVVIPKHLRKPWRECTDDELKEIQKLKGYKPGWVWFQKQERDKLNQVNQAINSIAW